ncbi:MAG: transposase, partial [Gemmatimonadaceae bacterium]
VESLLERGVTVFSLNPKQLDRFRDRFSVAGAKDDRLDARVLASALRTDQPRFRRLAIDEPAVIQVRELTRAVAVLTEEFTALTNRLRDLVHRIAPEWLTLSSNADDPWFWALLERAAPPLEGRRLRRATVERLLQSYRIRRVTPDEVVDVLERPPLRLAPGTGAAVRSHIALLLPRVRLVHEQRRACEHDLERRLDDLTTSAGPADPGHPGVPVPSGASDPGDVAILRSTPGIGTLVTATLIAEAHALLATRDYDALRAVTGVASVRRQTGLNKRGTVSMRYACNTRLRNACYHWARVSTCVDAAARTYYATLRARGHSHGRALRSVADRWLRILIAMLKARTLYDPTRLHDAPHDAPNLASVS